MDSENNPNQPVETAGGASDSASSGETPEERRARMMAEIKAKAAAKMAAKGGTPAPEAPTAPTVNAQSETATTAPPAATAPAAVATGGEAPADETPEQKRARIIAEAKAKAAAKMAAKGSAATTTPASETATAAPPPAQATVANAPSAPAREVPAGTPPAARVAPGAARASTSPTAGVAKGIPQGVAATQHPTVVDTVPDPPINKMRRRIVWASIIGFLGTSLLMFFRFFLPRSIFEPSSIFSVGFPGDYGIGVDTKYQQLYRIWVVKTSDRLFVINAVCTHLGCTPDWKASENKFKCPCHGSGYDSEGINFEGPAPRPMDRAHVELNAEGHIVVNKGILYDWPKGGENKFEKEGAYIPL
ncbi:MAG TPA: Rieske 2Fe-2S domain-containing protein [Pyrinomonadaceae bacterium]|nr:Rieske 2Fe-2S domain-containing protein [Pyrinomonadaceae bacterium]